DEHSEIHISQDTLAIGDAITVEASLRDQKNNAYISSQSEVTFQLGNGTSLGTFSTAINNGNGNYSSTFIGTQAGSSSTISVLIGNRKLRKTKPIQVVST